EFLRHIERTRLLVHVIDLAGSDPMGQLATVRAELAQYSPPLDGRPTIVAANKMDLPEARARWERFAARVAAQGQALVAIAAVRGEGIPTFLRTIVQALNTAPLSAAQERSSGEEKSS